MKRLLSMAAALVLAALMTACANTAADVTDPTRWRTPYATTDDGWRGNVSTTDDGRVNGTNRDQRDRRATDRAARRNTRTTRVNTDAMGAGMAQ